MPTFHDITTDQLRQMIQLRERIDFLQDTLRKLRRDVPTPTKKKLGRPAGKRTMSLESRAKMAAGQKARWAKINGKASPAKAIPMKAAPAKSSAKPAPKKKVMSPEAKAKIAAAMKARWEAKKNGSSNDR